MLLITKQDDVHVALGSGIHNDIYIQISYYVLCSICATTA